MAEFCLFVFILALLRLILSMCDDIPERKRYEPKHIVERRVMRDFEDDFFYRYRG